MRILGDGYSSRKNVRTQLKKQGGVIGGKAVTLDTDHLVMGGTANEHWKFSSFGRKIPKAMDVRDDERSKFKIIPEEQWFTVL